jgi:hypothetical protein
MSAPPRPQFFEGQLLAAGDLGAQVDYARFGDAVHARTQHTWGVVTGLGLTTTSQTSQGGDTYVDVTLKSGIAIDPSGRRIVVDTDQLLSTVDFTGLGIAGSTETAALYPVYLLGVDQPQQAASAGNCATGSPTRVAETFQITFGRPGSEPTPAPIAVSAQPTTGSQLLVGYVTFDPNISGGEFTSVATSSPTGAVQYAGVVAAEVVAPAGSVVLQTQSSGAKFVLALTEGTDKSCTLTFGKQAQDGGAISKTFQVDDKGDVTFSGTWNVQLPTVPVVESGVIGHGLCIPLPENITADMITGNQFSLHVVVSPLQVGLINTSTTSTPVWSYATPLQCTVDVARRVTSLMLWTSGATTSVVTAPCQYLIIASPT